MDRYRNRWRDDRDWNDRWRDERPRDDYDRGRDFGWRGTELDRGFAGHYPYDRGYDRDDRYRDDRDRYRDDDRYRYASGDPYFERGFERPRDYDRDRDMRFRDREYGRDYWDNYPWNRYGR